MSERTLEDVKIESDLLRGTLAQTLDDPTQDGFSEDDKVLIKFHGLYQQKNRDKLPDGSAHDNSFLIRGRIPGGRISAEQYLAWDDLADLYGGGSLRLTTRQTFQLHGVRKDDLRTVMQAIHKMNLTTAASCGDVVRNVTQVVNPKGLPELKLLDAPAQLLSDHFLYNTSAWTEVWLEQKRVAVPGDEKEPFYGATYLPRKFKIAVTAVGDNGVDLFTNDLGFAADFAGGAIAGYFVFAGGGMGMNHNKPETFPRIADLVGYITADKLLTTAQAIISVHRDYGDRTNRKHARLKYVIHDKGLEWFRAEVEKIQGFAFAHKVLPAWNTPNYLGWHECVDGTWALGVHILSGRIKNLPAQSRLKSALREIVRDYKTPVQLTADQDLILLGIQTNDKALIEETLVQSGYTWQSPSKLFDRALACVALPTCGLALAEAERVLAELLQGIDSKLEIHGLKNRAPIVRLTGCPNGCARPYAAEIGIVGQLPGKYALFIGGTPAGDRIAGLWTQKVPFDMLAETLERLFAYWKNAGHEQESLGGFVQRVGIDSVKTSTGVN